MEFRILGPLDVANGAGPALPAAPKPRALLGVLLLHPNEAVSSERLIDELWGERPPPTAAKVLQTYVSQLRRVIGPDAIATRPPGYLLRIDEEALDATRFRRLAAEGRSLAASSDHDAASARYREALALWRGPPLADVVFESFARSEVERLEEERLAAAMDLTDSELALGHHQHIVPELEMQVRQHPLRERLRAQLMLALYRSGRQADALTVYQEARRTLIQELGLEPGRELQALEQAVLAHDPALDPSQPTSLGQSAPLSADLPRGTVTLLFTDIEESTTLLRQLREAYPHVLASHRRLLHDAFAKYGGQEVDREGDSFFVVFHRAKSAVAAASTAQLALADHRWPDGVELRVRMGIHTAEPVVSEERYVGLGVHRAARVMAAGHGGQILISSAAREVLLDDPPPGVDLRELGEYRLKDFEQPERIYQLVVPGLKSEFPPLKTPMDQPDQATSFDARQQGRARAAIGVRPLRSRRNLLLLLAATVTAGAVVGAFLVVGGSGTAKALSAIDANAVGVVDEKHGSISAQVPVGASPAQVAVGHDAVWVSNFSDHTVSRVDPAAHLVRQTIRVGNGPGGIAASRDAVWVANGLDGTIARIDPETNAVVQTTSVGNGPGGLAYGNGSIWVANSEDSTVSRIEPRRGDVVETIEVGGRPSGIATGDGAVWVTNESAGTVSRIDPATNAITQTINVGSGPTSVAVGDGFVWVANTLDGTVSRVDPRRRVVTGTIAVGQRPAAVAVGSEGVWVANEAGGTLSRIDPRKAAVAETIEVGHRPEGLAVVDDKVWVTVHASSLGHRGGTLRVLTSTPPDSIDTGRAYSGDAWAILTMTNDGLTGIERDGTSLVPDLAVALATPTDGGRTYQFELRPGIRYSNGAVVKPGDFRYALERLFKLGSPGIGQYAGIVGGSGCAKRPQSCNLAKGIVTDDQARTITFHLTAPDPEFLYKLGLPFAAAVPAGTPNRDVGTRPLPATGPYMIERYAPTRRLVLVRNPRFREWSQAAQPSGYPDRIDVRIGVSEDAGITAVEHGKADVAFQGPPADRLKEVQTQYASQWDSEPQSLVRYVFLNTRLPPFDDVRVRRALNYAVDRNVASRLQGGPSVVHPTCQILPPNFPGYSRYCPYTVHPNRRGIWRGPDMVKARRLIASSHTRSAKVTVWTNPFSVKVARYLVSLLNDLGYRASLKKLRDPGYAAAIADSRRHAQAGIIAWIADYPAPSNFINVLLSCQAFRLNTSSNNNLAQFCDRRIDADIGKALRLQVIDPPAARRLWAEIDREVVDRAPWVPLHTFNQVNFVSKRVGNFEYNPQFGLLLDQLRVR